MMKRARIIYNPTSGREIFKKKLPDVLQLFEQAGYETSCHATTGAGDATIAAREACERKFDLVVACGGDGTLNEVISGMAEQEYRPKLGLIPVGTTNDFARAIGVNVSIMEAAEVITNGQTVPLDIGRVDDKYFVNILAAGKITELTYEVPSKLKTMLGQLAYYLKGIEMLPRVKPTRLKIEYDGKVFDEEAYLFLLSNTNSVGGFEKIAPEASINDGQFDLLVLKKSNIAEIIRVCAQLLSGQHVQNEYVLYTRASHLKIMSDDKLLLNIDGEYGGETPCTVDMLYNHLEIYVP
ncbi:diacylglycerol kinase [Gottfriedia sp. NPDC057991]|uniref:Diacylglycerol kinase n=1 Tax=Gottfriedia acidiceleris TaxID=371036 RepID=A0ABY4JMG6_9BACI|nr:MULTISPECIES: diacylglycerol kinase [Bacillaceae]PEC51282.1 diacylglycerol kinase [Bacillus sp. AFS096315]PFH83277.1 diacylglycerol kinase [Bacillus sp. AFS088145]PFM83389.1 diacylglycerol kinase [Bacillus sp. AFS077874]UPM54621.1 diacylglycerol kinase [Gottfriedia acidiceleris]